MTRPEFYVVWLHADNQRNLCRCCTAVLVNEGQLGGDPAAELLSAEDVTGMWPYDGARGTSCSNCEALRRFEEKRALLSAPPQRIGEAS